MNKLFIIFLTMIFAIGCIEKTPEAKNKDWVKLVKGQTFSGEGSHLIFDDNANMIMKMDVNDDITFGEAFASLFVGNMTINFFSSPEKNKGIYTTKILFINTYIGFSVEGKEIYMYDFADMPDKIDWDKPTGTLKRK